MTDISNDHDTFVPISEIINRDIESKQFVVYQVQSNTDNISANIVPVGKFAKMPIVPIFKLKRGKFNCELFSFMLAFDEIQNKNKFKMIGYMIELNGKIVASVEFLFVVDSNRPTEDIKFMTNMKGSFEIVFCKKTKDGNVTDILRTMNEYPGKHESIEILTEELVNVLQKISIRACQSEKN